MRCEGFDGPCGAPLARARECRTRYANETQNVQPILCEDCYEAYTDYWDEKWDEYYGGLL